MLYSHPTLCLDSTIHPYLVPSLLLPLLRCPPLGTLSEPKPTAQSTLPRSACSVKQVLACPELHAGGADCTRRAIHQSCAGIAQCLRTLDCTAAPLSWSCGSA